jgi:hypothetical protein
MFVNKDNMKAWLIHHGVSANNFAEVIVIDVVFPESFKWIFMVHKENGDKTHETLKFLLYFLMIRVRDKPFIMQGGRVMV